MSLFARLAFAGSIGLLSACQPVPSEMTQPDPTPASANAQASRNFLYAHAMYGEPVFDRDVISFQRALTTAFGAPASVERFGYTDRRLTTPSGPSMNAAISRLAAKARDGEDVVVVMFTTHGNQDILAQKPAGGELSFVPAQAVRAFLEPLQNDKQIIIIQACYSGSLIDDLAGPNRIILTAAAEDRTSFGCAPDNDNTWFIKSLNAALAQGGSWAEINARTQANVRALEESRGFPPNRYSNPQFYVGRNMRDVWNRDGSNS